MSESQNKNEEAINKEEILRAEKEEEAKLKAKYPAVRPGPQLLQKRMQKGVIRIFKPLFLHFFLKIYFLLGNF